MREHKLSREEVELLRAAEGGDKDTVVSLLDTHPDLNVNCTDMMGRTPLRLAASNEHLTVVELLLELSEDYHIYDALLHAIKSNHEEICALILRHPRYEVVKAMQGENENGEREVDHSGSSQFSSDITPIILAAQHNRFETVMLLLQMGEVIPHPHPFRCPCTDCEVAMHRDELRFAKSRVSAYRGLASEAYISLSAKDPILRAFVLSKELEKVARMEKYYRTEYEQLSGKLSDYVVALMDNVRGDRELDVVLNATEAPSWVDLGSFAKLARLKFAIFLKEKKFIAHPICQKKLNTILIGELHFLRHLSMKTLPFVIMAFFLGYPVFLFAFWFAPWTKIGRILKTPVVKLVQHTLSYLSFLGLLIAYSFSEKESILAQNSIADYTLIYELFRSYNKTSESCLLGNVENWVVRPYLPNQLLMMILLWIIGMLWQECKQIYNEGLKGYLDSSFNWIDFCLLTFYLSSFALRFLCFIKVENALHYFSTAENWERYVNSDSEAAQQFYWLIADRYYWDIHDPQIICEGLFALGNLLSFCRLSYILAVDDSLGPLQLSLGLMIKDVMRFMIILFLFMLAFFVGLHNLYWYYSEEVLDYVQINVDAVEAGISYPAATDAFGSTSNSLTTIFWALFGMADADVTELGAYNNSFTENIGVFMYALYNFAMVIILLNMLIAMMSRTFELVSGDQDAEWKFALTTLYMEYIKDFSSLPVPLNIIPSPKSVLRPFTALCNLCKKPKENSNQITHVRYKKDTQDISVEQNKANNKKSNSIERNASMGGNNTDESSDDEDLNNSESKHRKEYREVIKKVVNRYIEQMVTMSSIVLNEEIKQDLSSFRFEVLSVIKRQDDMMAKCVSSISTISKKQSDIEDTITHLHITLANMLCEVMALRGQYIPARRGNPNTAYSAESPKRIKSSENFPRSKIKASPVKEQDIQTLQPETRRKNPAVQEDKLLHPVKLKKSRSPHIKTTLDKTASEDSPAGEHRNEEFITII